ncbi:MAG: phosphoribosyltransferase, partial [Cyanobacteria bacterium J083]
QNIVRTYGVKAEEIQAIIATSKAELRWQARCYRKYRSMLEISDRIVILVDDGIARGLTTYAAVKTLKQRQPQKIIIATPMALLPAIKILQTEVDDIVCLFTAKDWQAVGLWYQSLKPVTDQEICDLLSQGTQKRLVNSFH